MTEKARKESAQQRRAAALDVTLLRHLPAWHPKRKEAEDKGLI